MNAFTTLWPAETWSLFEKAADESNHAQDWNNRKERDDFCFTIFLLFSVFCYCSIATRLCRTWRSLDASDFAELQRKLSYRPEQREIAMDFWSALLRTIRDEIIPEKKRMSASVL